MVYLRTLVLVIGAGLVGSQAQAQIVVNPSRVEFVCPDHALDDQHELDIVQASGNRLVITTLLLGDPPEVSGIVGTSINVQPIAFGDYVARVRAVAATAESVDSPDSNLWRRAPGAPTKVVTK